MKLPLLSLPLAVGLVGLLGACKKADQVQPDKQAAPSQVTGAGSKTGVLLRPKWPLNNRYVYQLDMDQHSTNKIPQMPTPMQQEVTMRLTYAVSVQKETTDGGRELELEFLANSLEVRMGGRAVMSFDSKQIADGDTRDPMAVPLRKMIGSKVRLLANQEGKVTKVLDLDIWREGLSLEEAGQPGQMLAQQFNQGFFLLLADSGRSLSPKPVTVGETWPFKAEFPAGATGKLAIDAKITLAGWENHAQRQCAILDSRGTLKGTTGDETGPMGKMTIDGGKLTGKAWFDPELGANVEYVADQFIHVKGEIPGQAIDNGAAARFTSEIGQKISVKLVELGKTKG